MVSSKLLTKIGYDLTQFPFVSMTTGSGIVRVPDLKVSRLEALGQERLNSPLLAHDLPSTATVDGFLGLDLLRGHIINIDLRLGKLTVD